MSSTADLLLFGHDATLQQTRAWILQRNGLVVDSVTSLVELRSCLAARPYRLLVLCHSLSSADRDAAISLALSFRPAVRLLALTRANAGVFNHPYTAVSEGPAALLRAVHNLLTNTETLTHSTKRKIPMAQFEGVVKWFNNAKGYGFLGRDGGPDVFTHFTSIQTEGYKSLKEGQLVSFDVVQGEKGPQADQVHILSK